MKIAAHASVATAPSKYSASRVTPCIVSGPRIGVDYAGDDAALPYRFVAELEELPEEIRAICLRALAAEPNNPEVRLRAWGMSRVLSGDIITEQNIHTLDVMSWIMNKNPVKARGTFNQKVRPWGDCSDHFSVIYDYRYWITSRSFVNDSSLRVSLERSSK